MPGPLSEAEDIRMTRIVMYAASWDIVGVARTYADYLQGRDLSQPSQVYLAIPELSGKGPAVGYDGRGVMSFQILNRDQETGAMIVLAMMYDCAAPPHLHKSGEDTISLSGRLAEHEWTRGSHVVTKTPEGLSRTVWAGTPTFHQPFTDGTMPWVGIYYQQGGLVLFDRMKRSELQQVLGLLDAVPANSLTDWSDERLREWISTECDLMMPQKSA